MKKINIISKNNGVGLSKDYEIVRRILEAEGHQTRFLDVYAHDMHQADINICLELTDPKFIPLAKINFYIPNPEWFYSKWIPCIYKMDQVIAKTADTFIIFRKYTPRVTYTSFTSIDHRIEGIKKAREFIHIAGKSSQKNTESVYQAWRNNPGLPMLHLLKQEKNNGYDDRSNVKIYRDPLNNQDIKYLMNRCIFHLCPSQYEGFGHYIHEAKSVGAIIMLTDAPPMNEFAKKDAAFFATGNRTGRHNLGLTWKVQSETINEAARRMMAMSDQQIETMSKAIRQDYEDNEIFFINQFTELIRGACGSI